ncbi:uncharacterized protein LOC109843817 [Asparagus officinalis]|uniref:uncharacterized protein LOC109843817 n=1 Tax=Asparagus officinalis TaxID=4686 RepID=UPI00098DF18C|nr:uncharacterized protein LOC109843817 [Asparagus officinalis]XP_020268371.1 uncharacterized protein LOC109843817 [Asparagus officinalis]
MKMSSSKGRPGVITVAVGGLAIFLVMASFLLSLNFFNLSFRGNFTASDGNEDVVVEETLSSSEEERVSSSNAQEEDDITEDSVKSSTDRKQFATNDSLVSSNGTPVLKIDSPSSGLENDPVATSSNARMKSHEVQGDSTSDLDLSSDDKIEIRSDSLVPQKINELVEINKDLFSGFKNDSKKERPEIHRNKPSGFKIDAIATSSNARMKSHEMQRDSTSDMELSSDDNMEIRSDASVFNELVEIDKDLSSGFKDDTKKESSDIHKGEAITSPPKLKIKKRKAGQGIDSFGICFG